MNNSIKIYDNENVAKTSFKILKFDRVEKSDKDLQKPLRQLRGGFRIDEAGERRIQDR